MLTVRTTPNRLANAHDRLFGHLRPRSLQKLRQGRSRPRHRFEVRTGEVFGLLGPTEQAKPPRRNPRRHPAAHLRRSPRSRFDPDKQKTQLKDRIGVCLQATNLPDKIRVVEAVELFGALYSRMLSSETLLKRLELWDKREAFYTTLSGGQKQRSLSPWV